MNTSPNITMIAPAIGWVAVYQQGGRWQRRPVAVWALSQDRVVGLCAVGDTLQPPPGCSVTYELDSSSMSSPSCISEYT